MKKGSISTCVALAAIAVAGSGLFQPAAAMGVMHLIEHATTDTVTDLGAKDDSVGDLLTFSNDIFDKDNKTKLGTDNGYCIRTVVGKAWECFWTVTLPKGQITVEGPFFDASDSKLAITGGTGIYSMAPGEMTLHARDSKGSEYDFIYTLK